MSLFSRFTTGPVLSCAFAFGAIGLAGCSESSSDAGSPAVEDGAGGLAGVVNAGGSAAGGVGAGESGTGGSGVGGAGSGGMAGGSSGGGTSVSGGASSVGGEGQGGGSGGMLTGAGGAEAGFDYAASVENTGADCTVPELAEPGALPTIEKMPDPFTKIDGTRLMTKSEWRCRRQEIHKQAEKYIYGERPSKPEVVTGSVSDTQVSVHVEAEGTSIDFSSDIVLPSTGDAPYPAIINIGGKGGFGGLSLGESRILEQGVAVIYYDHNQMGKEGAAEASRGLDNPGLFYDIYGGDHSAGLLMAWAWGASRMIDVLQASGGDIIDVGSLGVTGCSRNGKGAFTVGVFDERIALTIPQETSTGGVPLYRMVDILNTERTDHNYYGLNWLSNDFEPFVYANNTSNAVKLPIDSHEMVAMIAPRGLLVLENPFETQMSAPAGHAATMGGLEVFKALGVEDHLSYHSSVSNTGHCSYKDEYTDLLVQNIGRFLKHENETPGEIIVGNNGDGNPASWITWDTPALQD